MNDAANFFTCFTKGKSNSPLACLSAQAIHKVHANPLCVVTLATRL